MTSWRDTASSQAQDDLDGLLNAVLSFAVQLLQQHGEMFPFGASVDLSGTTAMLGADPGLGELPPADAVLAALREGARSQAASLRAAAYAADVSIGRRDAIRVELEHREGVAIAVLAPYKRSRFATKLQLGELSLAAGALHAWA